MFSLPQMLDAEISADSVRAALRSVMSGDEFVWRERPAIIDQLVDLWRWLMSWLSELGGLHPVVYWLLVAGLLVILTAILAHLAWTLSRAFRRPDRGQAPATVPTAALRDAGWHRAEAERLKEAGRFIEALAHHFVALLLELDQRKIVRFHPSKTPREYIQEVDFEVERRAAFAELVSRLYGHVFGGVSCSKDELDAYERRIEELEAGVAAR